MIRERAGDGGGDRERRAELERLQAELAQVRTLTARAGEDHERAVEALNGAISAAELERAAADAKVRELEQERRVIEPHLEIMRQGLIDQENEARVRALGASRRDIVFKPEPGEPFAYRAERLDEVPRDEPRPPVPMTVAEREGWKLLAWVAAMVAVILLALVAGAR
jgi:hypothetical protein